ncbi:MAG: hypothetical protein ABIB71_02035 [Candidatus Woesearchaeota archaeon]
MMADPRKRFSIATIVVAIGLLSFGLQAKVIGLLALVAWWVIALVMYVRAKPAKLAVPRRAIAAAPVKPKKKLVKKAKPKKAKKKAKPKKAKKKAVKKAKPKRAKKKPVKKAKKRGKRR